MVVMMDGTDTDFGPQVGASFFGYLIGVACPVASFIFGRHIFDWLRSFHPLPQAPSIEDGITAGESEDHAGGAAPNDQQAGRSVLRKLCKIRYIPMVASIGLIFAFAYGDAVKGSLVYRKMWMATLLSPLGSVLRWRLSELNYRKRGWIGFEWLPWGTFAANIVAVMISAFTESLDSHVIDADDAAFDWLSPALQALGVGFAGSLSTMSTLVHEMFFLETPGKANGYCFTSIVCSMLIGLLIYSPIARSG